MEKLVKTGFGWKMENVSITGIWWASNKEMHYVTDLGDSAEEIEIKPTGLKVIDKALI